MKFTISWVREHLELTDTVDEIINILASAGLPCEKIFRAQDSWFKTRIVKILAKEKHPNADRLNIYTIQNQDQTLRIVCGDSTLERGMHVPFAAPGTKIGEIVLRVANIRGIESPGMLCAASELELPIEQSGVLRCHQDDFGKTIAEAFEDTAIIEAEITPNRGDALSIRGIARNIAMYGGKSKLKALPEPKCELVTCGQYARIESQDCAALAVTRVKHKAKSTSAKIANRLRLTGHNVTDIDIVDVTNYVAHELGHPMHAFDYTKLAGKIVVQNLAKAAEFIPLKGEKIELEKNTLVITDDAKVVSWPGVMGGANSCIDALSEDLLLECGVFKVDAMQRRKNKIITMSAKRFECGVDPENLLHTLQLFTSLLGVDLQQIEYKPFEQKKVINFDLSYVRNILGIELTVAELKNILEARGFMLNESGSEITVPSFRYFDVHTANCIVEEIAMGKYHEIKSINLAPLQHRPIREVNHEDMLVQSAIQNGFFEMCNFSITNKEHPYFAKDVAIREVKNSTNANYAFLRPTLVEQLLKNATWHINNGYKQRKFFELGWIYGAYDSGKWLKTQKRSFVAVSDCAVDLRKLFGHFLASSNFIMPGVQANKTAWLLNGAEFWVDDKKIAVLGRVQQDLHEEYYVLEIYLENLGSLQKRAIKKPAVQAPIYRDLSFALPAGFEAGKLTQLLIDAGYDFSVFDIYPSDQLHIARNFGLRFVYEHHDQVSKEEMNAWLDAIKTLVHKKLSLETV